MFEAALLCALLALFLAFALQMGITLDQETNLRDVNYALSRHLATDLAQAWATGKIAQAPWNGSCNAYLRTAGAAFLAGRSPDYSMSDPAAKYYFGALLDSSQALLPDLDSPYAILRVAGRTQPFALGTLFPLPLLSSEDSLLVEYYLKACNDPGY